MQTVNQSSLLMKSVNRNRALWGVSGEKSSKEHLNWFHNWFAIEHSQNRLTEVSSIILLKEHSDEPIFPNFKRILFKIQNII